ncbi:MAG: cytochrome c [Alphaproteobacteria bacterium]|nr:cytochrome c [Alphaproteobacteria bacterium]
MKFVVPSMVVLLASTTLAHAQDGDARRGLSLVRQVCAECHEVQAQELKSPNPKSPTFPELAKTPGMTSAALTVALTTPHAGMPMFRLSADQRADIIAYVLSLKQQGAQPGK